MDVDVDKVSRGQIWRSQRSGEVYIVTALYRDVLTSYALLSNVTVTTSSKRAKVVKSVQGETIAGFTIAEII